MKYFKLLAAALVLAGLMCTAAFAEETITEADSREVTIKIDDEVLNTDVSSIYEPEKGVTLVPFRAIFEAVGAEVEPEHDKDGHTTAVTATKDDIEVKMVINDTHVTVTKGEKVTTEDMGAAPEIQNGYTMIPVRFAAKDFGYTVDWDQETLTVIITKNKESGEDETETSTEDAESDETEVSTEETTESGTEVSTVINKEYSSSDGSINTYTGEVSGSSNNQIPNGNGKMVYGASGSEYDGQWENGKRKGYGTMTWYKIDDSGSPIYDQNGNKIEEFEYQGYWDEDAANGKGTLFYYDEDGVNIIKKSYGEWENNTLVKELDNN
ncbi:MAG: hypothetical protein LUG24_07930 [Clostridiales bacterium]|nr:hypothetical protein [Clostridiales bacterium]